MTDPNYSVMVLVLDKSGSMQSIRQPTINSVNEFIQTQKEAPGLADMAITLFNHQYQVGPLTKLADVPEFSPETYAPGGDTAMLAAVSGTIDEIGKRLAALPEERRPGNVIFAVMTDGQENPPQGKPIWDALKAKIRKQTEQFNWKFIFLGANIDSASVAGFMGFDQHHVSNYAATPKGMGVAMAAVSYQVSAMRDGVDRLSTQDFMARAQAEADELDPQVSSGDPKYDADLARRRMGTGTK